MFEDSLADVPTDGEIFEPEEGQEETPVENTDEQVTDTPADSPSEDESETEKAPSQEGADDGDSGESSSSNTSDEDNIPFNKHPRWQELQDTLKQLKSENDSLKGTVESLSPKLEALEAEREKMPEKIPAWFANLYGEDNQEAWSNYKTDIESKISSVKDEIRAEMEAERQQQASETEKWNAWMNESIKAVEDKHSINLAPGTSDRNEFLAFVMKYKPTNDEGVIDLELGYDLYSQAKEAKQAQKSEKNQARKKIAATTTTDKAAEPKQEYNATHKSLRKKSFLDLALESLNEN